MWLTSTLERSKWCATTLAENSPLYSRLSQGCISDINFDKLFFCFARPPRSLSCYKHVSYLGATLESFCMFYRRTRGIVVILKVWWRIEGFEVERCGKASQEQRQFRSKFWDIYSRIKASTRVQQSLQTTQRNLRIHDPILASRHLSPIPSSATRPIPPRHPLDSTGIYVMTQPHSHQPISVWYAGLVV